MTIGGGGGSGTGGGWETDGGGEVGAPGGETTGWRRSCNSVGSRSRRARSVIVATAVLSAPYCRSRRALGDRALALPCDRLRLAFLQHVYRGLKPGGRAAVVLRDRHEGLCLSRGRPQRSHCERWDRVSRYDVVR